MITEICISHKVTLILKPETEVELAVLKQMAAAASSGRKITITSAMLSETVSAKMGILEIIVDEE